MILWQASGNKDYTTQSVDDEEWLREPAAYLASGQLIAFPTETVYGLGADARNEAAVQSVFRAKGRPSDNPLIVHIYDICQLEQVTPSIDELPSEMKRVMEAFWPGPLTILVPAHPQLAPSVHPGTPRVGVRVPAHPIARRFIELAGCPVAAPSANKSGRPSPTLAEHVMEDFGDDITGVIDGGPCQGGVESTVIHFVDGRISILRPGLVTASELAQVSGLPVDEVPGHAGSRVGSDAPVLAPGTKYRHYAPNARVHVWWGDASRVTERMRGFIERLGHPSAQTRLAIIAPTLHGLPPQPLHWTPAGEEDYTRALTRDLYGLLRRFDTNGATDILIHGARPEGFGLAVMNRLEKASEGRMHRV